MNVQVAMQQYRQVGNHSSAEDASPHKLILMLLTGAQERIATAKTHMVNGNIAAKGETIGTAMNIIVGLRASLDHDKGGAISSNLDALYEYMEKRLFDANLKNDPAILEEVSNLLKEITSAWAGIADQI
ncbi:MAG: flagellar export chaperone FliS [Gammaproteobacteria bacterium]|nr:flagellar export chaperone FliS [Gammaproteobacteria bacterium]